ncbi:MAG TPA: hypothetical protein VF058_05495 [Actinomycetota bacterium]
MRPLPEPSHAPIGFSYEVYPTSRRWLGLALLVILTMAVAVAAAVRLVGIADP